MLVTGGAGFVGSWIARAIARDVPSSRVVALDNLSRRGVELNVNVLRDAGVRFVHGDVRNADDVDGAVQHCDLIVDCSAETSASAGYDGSPQPVIETNLLGPILCARAVLPDMMRQKGGVILNVSSVSAVRPSQGQSVYAATKGGVESLTRALAREYGRKGIRVHGIRPGPIDTSMIQGTLALAEEEVLSRIPLQRLGRPEEVAELATYLLSDRAAYVSGSIHTIDGGYLEG